MEAWTLDQNDDAVFVVTIRDEAGEPFTGYTGFEPIDCAVWAGNELPALPGIATAEWLSAPNGTIQVSIAGTGTKDLVPASYDLKLEISNVAVFRARLIIQEASGSQAGRTAKITLRHLRKHFKSVEKLLCGSDDPTAIEARADAWDWFTTLLHKHYRSGMGLSTDNRFVPGISFGGAYPFGVYRDGRRNPDLQAWLDDDKLILTTEILDCMALYALAQICGGQVDVNDEADWNGFSARFAGQAEALAVTITAELDTDDDGVADVVIRLSSCDTLEG